MSEALDTEINNRSEKLNSLGNLNPYPDLLKAVQNYNKDEVRDLYSLPKTFKILDSLLINNPVTLSQLTEAEVNVVREASSIRTLTEWIKNGRLASIKQEVDVRAGLFTPNERLNAQAEKIAVEMLAEADRAFKAVMEENRQNAR